MSRTKKKKKILFFATGGTDLQEPYVFIFCNIFLNFNSEKVAKQPPKPFISPLLFYLPFRPWALPDQSEKMHLMHFPEYSSTIHSQPEKAGENKFFPRK